MPVPGSAKKKSVISYLSTERVFRTVGHRKDFKVPSRYGASADTYNWRTYRRIKYLYMVFLEIFYEHKVVGEDTYFSCTKMGGEDIIALTRAF